jgi:hypothetical protein
MTAAKLRLGVPVLNGGDLLLRLVASIDVPAEILVLVNSIGPTDASVTAAVHELENEAASCDVQVSVVRIAGNLGVAGSWNYILDHFGGDCVICNSDIHFMPGALREAQERITSRPDVVLQYLWASACFYAGRDFTRQLGWFDENIYPAYHEDQEMSLRAGALGVCRVNVFERDAGQILHGGSETLRNAEDSVRWFINEAARIAGLYLARRWGTLPPPGEDRPQKRAPFGDDSQHPANWTLDLDARRDVTRICKELTGWDCPLVFHRADGGFSHTARNPSS